MNEAFYQKLRTILDDNQIMIEEPLARHTTFLIGGPAWFLVLPESVSDVAAVVKLCLAENMPYYIMGNGSNLLVSDKGYRGTIIKLGQSFSKISIDEEKYIVRAEAGVLLSKLANEVADHSLTGFEFAAGIPGTLGGAVTMNAGAYDGEIKQAILEAVLLDKDGNILRLNKEELKMGYRTTIIQENHYIVLEAVFGFQPGVKEDILSKIKDLNARRREKQPLEYPSAGSTFKRPAGYYAGKLIMDSGLRGYQVGNAQVSEKHCGFVINKGGATATEVKTLISDIIEIVNNKFGVVLEPEVKLLGEF
ncbi:UDP-N-acetylmuramate dehydrogenase [Anaerocolumna sedimenticola]|uniref:UDP-N-acetylenolpyruvoylglucosamine reductase n=1 Tax=Anaerocolumna sedimenticola TaxID=2696063 RepID=A0A6P1TKQ6_9FIRM|nr:UDP-N-acetylmuramate dehydrogenase [Anaerocolumna sedimenticola]QHQ60719.1 UDP-N-acetylmuramate dehydrogenase [Anaerocolumna sedimenticola]